MLRNKSGITLISLIITIIILVILAGVALNTLVGANGIISNINTSTEKYKKAQKEEQLALIFVSLKMTTTGSEKINVNELQEKIDKEYGENIITISDNANNNLIINVVETGKEYEITNDGEVTATDLIDDTLEENAELRKFITVWKVEAGETITLPLYEKQEADEERGEKETYFNYNFTVDYGDGTIKKVTSYNDENRIHTYANAGTYEVSITGLCEGWSFTSVPNNRKNIIGFKQWGVIKARHIDFSSCINLTGKIPIPTTNSFNEMDSLRLLFYGCTDLTCKIPSNLFKNGSHIATLRNAFNFCGVTGNIPANLFENCTQVETLGYIFGGASNINGEIPEKLLKTNIKLKDAEGIFSEIHKISGNIPEKLFENCKEIINLGRLFDSCENLTGSIPEKLFANCKKVKQINQIFQNCKGLTGNIPENLFENNTEIKNIMAMFNGCENLSDSTFKIPAVLRNYRTSDCFNNTKAKFTIYLPIGQQPEVVKGLTSNPNVTVIEY